MKNLALFLNKYRRCHLWSAVLLAFIGLFYLFRTSRGVMNAAAAFTAPIKRVLSLACSVIPYSVGELLTVAAGVLALWYIVRSAILTARAEHRLETVYHRFLYALRAVLAIWLAFCLTLGVTYYSDSFQDKSGIRAVGGTVDELYALTVYFAEHAVQTGALVERDSNGLFCAPVNQLLAESPGIYTGIEKEFPFLNYSDIRPKKVVISKVLSAFGYTGFYFPFTGEANINIDCPTCIIPVTIAHEMAHQRGTAAEDEANFVAIAACLSSGNIDYEYSGWLFGYMHLSNALYMKDPQRLTQITGTLSPGVVADIVYNNDYWNRLQSPVSDVSDAVYDSFLKSYGQSLGIESYGAVVDLLLAYYGQN